MSSLEVNHLKEILKFLNVAEKLKCEMRHSWLSSGRQESVAEHSWRMSLMVILFAPHLSQPVDVEKCLKMSILHDLAEAEVGDIPVFELQSADSKEKKQKRELEAMETLCRSLPKSMGDDLFTLWLEYEKKTSFEAKFVNALDKIEVHLQHVEASLSTWLELEKDMFFQDKWMKAHCQFDSTLLSLAETVLELGVHKLSSAGEDVELIAQRATS